MKFLIILIAIPLIEIALFIKIGEIIGISGVLIFILASAVIGIALLRKQSFSIIEKIKAQHQYERDLSEDVFIDFSKFIGAILFIIPGFFTDFIGILLYIPWVQSFFFKNNINLYPSRSKKKPAKDKNKTIIDVEYIELDDKNEDKKQ